MSFELNGETWVPQTASEHAKNIIQRMNAILQNNNITDNEGNVVQIKESYGNALYLLALGDGEKFAKNDEKLLAAINSFNIELADDNQINNLLPIAAVTQNPGSYSTLLLTVTASDDGTCTIPAGTKAPYGDMNFVVQEDVVLSAGTSQNINTVADVIGPIAVLSGEVDAFDTDIPNLTSVINGTSSIPGVAPETVNNIRQRLLKGETIKYTIDGCQIALEELTGVNYARVYFNFNTTEPLLLEGGVSVQPRTAYIVVAGENDNIAETYASYMSSPTQNSPIAAGTYSTVTITVTATTAGSVVIPSGATVTYNGKVFATGEETTIEAGNSANITLTCTEIGPNTIPAYAISGFDTEIENIVSVVNNLPAVPGTDNPAKSQNWITQSGQIIPIYYDQASNRNVFVKITLEENAEAGVQIENQLKRDLILSSSTWEIGEKVTQLLTSAPFVNCSYTTVAYTQVSLDGETWENSIETGCNVIPIVTDATIIIEQEG